MALCLCDTSLVVRFPGKYAFYTISLVGLVVAEAANIIELLHAEAANKSEEKNAVALPFKLPSR